MMVKPSGYDRSAFFYAWHGICNAVKQERNLRFHLFAAVCVLIMAIVMHVSVGRVALLVLTCSMVIALELLNTAIENCVDMICPSDDKRAGYIKDVAAGAVLVAAIGAAVIGLLIFGSALLNLLA